MIARPLSQFLALATLAAGIAGPAFTGIAVAGDKTFSFQVWNATPHPILAQAFNRYDQARDMSSQQQRISAGERASLACNTEGACQLVVTYEPTGESHKMSLPEIVTTSCTKVTIAYNGFPQFGTC